MGAGHHVYADKVETFNRYVIEACKLADTGETRKIPSIQTKSSSPTDELEGETSNTESEENISATNSSNAVSHSFSPQKTSS
jgi:abhydrolase domain-containing protein 5